MEFSRGKPKVLEQLMTSESPERHQLFVSSSGRYGGSPMSRDTVYYEIMDMMQDNCCPICELIKKRTLQSMNAFLYESVNDIGIRKELNEARGLCNHHSAMLLAMGDPLSHAIMYGDLIKEAVHDAEHDNYQPYDDHSGCRYCKASLRAETTYATAFLYDYPDDEFQEKYKGSGMLCMSHLHMIQVSSEKNKLERIYKTIRSDTLEKYDYLMTCLSEIRRKNDYRFSDEEWTEDEKSAWKKAVGVINGRDK